MALCQPGLIQWYRKQDNIFEARLWDCAGKHVGSRNLDEENAWKNAHGQFMEQVLCPRASLAQLPCESFACCAHECSV